MTTRTVLAGDFTYQVIDDLTQVYAALVWARVMDEPSGAAARVPFFARATLVGAQTKTTPDGIVCVSGDPSRVLPNHAAQPYAFTLTISANGYRDAAIPVVIPAGAALPVALPDVTLTPNPVSLSGRVLSVAGAALAGAKIASLAAAAPFAVMARQPARFAHSSGVTVQGRALTPSGAAKALDADARAGSITLRLNNRAGLAAGRILQLGNARLGELVVIDTLPPLPANPALPGDVMLTAPTRRSFAKNAAAQPFTLGAISGTPRVLARPASAGDALLILSGAMSEDIIEISDGSATEYAFTGALTDADGFYCVNGITRLKSIRVQASAGGFNPSAVMEYPLAYTLAVNQLDFRLKP